MSTKRNREHDRPQPYPLVREVPFHHLQVILVLLVEHLQRHLALGLAVDAHVQSHVGVGEILDPELGELQHHDVDPGPVDQPDLIAPREGVKGKVDLWREDVERTQGQLQAAEDLSVSQVWLEDVGNPPDDLGLNESHLSGRGRKESENEVVELNTSCRIVELDEIELVSVAVLVYVPDLEFPVDDRINLVDERVVGLFLG